jgi:hypothetical protein
MDKHLGCLHILVTVNIHSCTMNMPVQLCFTTAGPRAPSYGYLPRVEIRISSQHYIALMVLKGQCPEAEVKTADGKVGHVTDYLVGSLS